MPKIENNNEKIFPNRFKGKVIVVTGAGQGIGKAVANRIAQEGGIVVFVDRSEIVNDVVTKACSDGLKALAVLADLETYDGFQTVLKKAKAAFGKIDILINNVGGTIWAKPYHEYQEDQIIKEINRSLYPTLWGCRAAIPYFLEQGGGAIVNISSIATRGINRVPYSAAKGGVNAMTVSLAFEYAQQNIRINAVATGGTEAPPRIVPRNSNPMSEQEKAWYQQMVDQTIDSSLMKRYGTIDEQVSAILFLASDEASYITGTVMPVGGGDLG
jgi:dihydroxycyclohexadiene carboxylate dehydrogenase